MHIYIFVKTFINKSFLFQQKGEEDENVDVEGDCEQYEEYTWAGQTRIRATSMLEGGFASKLKYPVR